MVFSKDYAWYQLSDRKFSLVIPDSPKLRVHNNSEQKLSIFLKGDLLGDVPGTQKRYFFDLNVKNYRLEVVEVIAKDETGRVVYSAKLNVSYLKDIDWTIEIPSR